MGVEEVKANYNDVGLRVIEALYSDNYLSIGGSESSSTLATLAGIDANSRILDVGSGLGGPALHLAQTFGCQVTGLDIVELNIARATERAASRGLTHLADFKLGNALQMPFADASFNIVWGQDAWCHVPDKAQLISECARVLEPKGTIAFTDWVQTAAMEKQYEEEVLSATASTNLQTLDGYARLLEKHGFVDVRKSNISETFVAQYQAIMSRIETKREAISSEFSARVYDIVYEKNEVILNAFVDGKLGGCRLIARKKER